MKIIDNNDLIAYLDKKLPNFANIIQDMDTVTQFLQSVFNMEECKDIDNIQKIESSFIKEGINEELDNKIQTLMNSQDQLETCRAYFNTIIAKYETGTKTKAKKTKKTILVYWQPTDAAKF